MKRGEKAARNAVARILASEGGPVSLYRISVIADATARDVGARKSDLYETLAPYADLLPEGWTTAWVGEKEGSDSVLCAVPPDWRCGMSQSLAPLLGDGALLRRVKAPDFD